ncbi:ornithine carbamoyltransferase [Idiomarina sp. M1R2S28]|uniref:Ornithine carbamoyltransferase n=1 Tax=Idiomarina rhizosphaerae TaxID=2961572 RepID=A0A9X2JTZ1_9GAMM|nr:ornithine carbamoyltransferase [Idiomarina rhizosphaerae]MCP1338491.1 ornithine carbamoyltransferase [Idiomarina rhizosphaerae]
MMKHCLSGLELTPANTLQLLALAQEQKAHPEKYCQTLAGRSVVTLFEKPSLRTRLSFDIGLQKLGGHAVYLNEQGNGMGVRESVADYARNLSCWADAIVARVMSHHTLQELAQYASVPVVNSLCDRFHPCQALADFLTLQEHYGKVKGLKLVYLGDGNNVSHSLMLTAAALGASCTIICPSGYEPDADLVSKAKKQAEESGADIVVTHDIAAVAGADALYTDTWVSMGDDKPLSEVRDTFQPYQINSQLVEHSGATSVLHCQPAHRGYEITSDVMDGPLSRCFQQAENRLYAQNALLTLLLNPTAAVLPESMEKAS